MSILEDYRRFQEEQRAKGIDPSVAPRLTQEEQDVLRQEIAATSVDTTKASPQPSTDVSGTGMLTESRTQTQARESVTDATMSYEDRYNNLKTELTNQMDFLRLNDFTYVNPGDLDYIIDEQAKEFAKAGVNSILDIGKRTEEVTDRNVEVERFTDPDTGKTKYRYTEGMIGFGGTGTKTIEVDSSLVKPINTTDTLGRPETMYMAELPNEVPVLYNKKTNERIDVFQAGGRLYGGMDSEGQATKFGDLYSNVEGGAALNIEFMEDGTPMFYPLYKDTSDKGMINAAVAVGSLAIGNAGGFGKIGSAVGAGGAETAAAKAVGAAIVGGTGGYITGGDFKSAAIGAVLAGATTYGIQSGFVGDQLVNLGVPENWLNGNNPLGLEIPIGDASKPQAFANQLREDGYTIQTNSDGYQQVFNQNGIPESALTDKLNQSLLVNPTAKLTTFEQDMIDPATGDVVGRGTGITTTEYDALGNVTTTNYNIGSSGGYEQIGDPTVTSFDASPAANIARSQEALNQAVEDGIISAADASTVSTEIAKSGGVLDNLSESAKNVVKTVGGALTTAGIDLKSVFGEGFGGALQNLVGAGIDYTALQEIEQGLEQRGRDIQAEYAGLFKPYTVRTGLGVGTITPEEAVSVADVEYQPLRTAQLGAARGMFEDLPTTREEATAAQLAATRALTEPQRQREQERMLGTLAQRGLLGYGQTMPTVGGERRVSPIAESILSAQETARAQEALSAQQFGLTEAGRQQQLGAGLLRGAQTIDEAAMAGLTRAQDISATLQQRPEMAGLGARAQYEQLAALSEIERLRGLQSGARGLFGLPTQQGNVNIQQLIDLLQAAAPKTATG